MEVQVVRLTEHRLHRPINDQLKKPVHRPLVALTFMLALMLSPLVAQEVPTLIHKVEKQEDAS